MIIFTGPPLPSADGLICEGVDISLPIVVDGSDSVITAKAQSWRQLADTLNRLLKMVDSAAGNDLMDDNGA